MPVENFIIYVIIYVYCCVVDNYNELTKDKPLRKCCYQPKLSDSEVITMEIVGEFMGKDQDKSMWQYFQSHWKPWFPNLGSRSNFAKQFGFHLVNHQPKIFCPNPCENFYPCGIFA